MKIIKILMVILVAYLIYVFIFAVMILAFKKSSDKKISETFPENQKNSKFKNRDRVQLIESSKDGAKVRLRIIEDAQESIDISYYTLRDGEFTRIIMGSILDAADRGVQIRILLDSLSILPSLIVKFKYILYALKSHENIKVKFYGPLNFLLPLNWNKRLHNKIFIVDDKLALVGGRNIADNYYLGKTRWTTFSKDRDVIVFKDESLRDYPSVIQDIKNYYKKTWDYKDSKAFTKTLNSKQKNKSEEISKKIKNEYLKIKEIYKEAPDKVNWYEHTMATENIKFIHNPIGKINHQPWVLRELMSLSSQAKESIFIQSPYIIPSSRIQANFNQYDIDLKKTTILTNSYYSSPNHFAIAAYSNHRENMIDNETRIYEYQGEGSLHSKTYIFDDYISAVGSFNLDPRSSFINSESMIVIYGEEFADKLKQNVQLDLDKSLKVGKDYSYVLDDVDKGHVSKTKKVIIGILSKITPFIEHLL